MKKKILLLFTLIFLIVLVAFISASLSPNRNIHRILEKSEYSYLPKEAKNFIEKVYEESGEVILTEKNKEENVPYLNPKYVEYLTLSEEEQKDVAEVPEVYQLDYVVHEKVDGESLPSSYDLRNVNGKNFVTPLKDQDTMDLCWAFTSTEQAESLILKNSNTSYSSSSAVFSPRQLDYAISFDGIYNYENDFGIRPLAYGGNYLMALMAMSNGVGLTSESYFPFSLNMEQEPLSNVLNYGNSLYEVDSSIMVPSLSSNPSATLLNSYVNTVKNYVMQYGGVYTAAQAPNRSCGTINTDGTAILRMDSNCTQNSNHAMQIIGWDDNYSYSYCVSGKTHKPASTCSSGRVTGTGAWLVRNSWGEDDTYSYIYMAYDSIDYDVRLTSSISKMSARNWDNNYHQMYDNFSIVTTSSGSQYFKKQINTAEKIEKIKFFVYGEGATFSISITSNKENYKKIRTVSIPTAGLYTLDLHDDNVVITDSGFSVELLGNGSVYYIKNSISVFTSNVDDDVLMETDDIYLENTGSNYSKTIYTRTKNIASNQSISYTLKDLENHSYNDYLTVTNKVVAKNDVNANVIVSRSIPTGVYTLTTTYNGVSSSSKLYLGSSMDLSGSGTVSSPYIIQTEADLRKMAYKLNAHYKLANDITLTEKWVPIGTEAEPFTGSLNGNGHKIRNMEITDSLHGGLFGYVSINTSNTTSFKNIIIENPSIDGRGNTGALIGTLVCTGVFEGSSITYSATIQDVYVMGGHVYSYFGNAGAIIGSIEGPINGHVAKQNYTFNRIFNSSSVGGLLSSGMIGYVLGGENVNSMTTLNMTNIENVGNMDYTSVRGGRALFFSGTHGTMVGYTFSSVTVNLENYFSSSYFRLYSYSGNGLVGLVSNITANNGYSVTDSNIVLSNLTKSSNYSSWSGFSTNWNLNTIDGISRYPIIKGVNFPYSSISEITIQVGDEVYLSDYVTPAIDAAHRLKATNPTNTSVISVTNVTDQLNSSIYDAKIKGLSVGTSQLHVQNFYDGYEKDITITVLSDADPAEIVFYKNDGTDMAITQNTYLDTEVALNANTFTRVGYTFTGWNTKANGTGTGYSDRANVTVTSTPMKLYAQWSPISYDIRYYSNGGTGSMTKSTVTYDQDFTLKNNTFTRVGYTFAGWNAKADGTGTPYTNQQVVRNLCSVNGAEISLYAQWSPITYTIRYHANGGTGSMTSTSATYNQNINLKKNTYTKDGFVFAGWNTKADGTGTPYVDQQVVRNLSDTNGAEVLLYAQWTDEQSGPPFTITGYTVDEDAKIIDGISLKTNLNSYKSHFTLGSGYSISISLGDKDYIYTGSKVSFIKNGVTEATYTNIIRGDINGDGKMTALDYVKVKNHIMGSDTITNNVYKLAADANNDNKISALDYVTIKNYIMGAG